MKNLHTDRHVRSLFCPPLVMALVIATIGGGCGPRDGRIAVSGTVSLDGQPLTNGFISFSPTGPKGSPTGTPVTAGRYAARVSPGEMSVQIRATKSVTKENPSESDVERGITVEQREMVPTRYNSKTMLRVNVSDLQRQHDFALDSSPE
jgi:hypothetical protein